MRRIFGVLGIGVIVAIALAVRGDGSDLIANLNKTLSGAKSLNATYTVQLVGGSPSEYSVSLSKPNMARIDTPTQLTVADGTNITVLDKQANSYFKKPQTDADLKALFTADETNLWASFFGDNGFSKAVSTKATGTKTRQGMVLNSVDVSFDKDNRKVETLYLGKDDNLPHQAQILLNAPDGSETTILQSSVLNVGDTAIGADKFAFVAPADSKEMTLADMNSDKWYDNFEEAKKAAAASHRLLMVDFYADW